MSSSVDGYLQFAQSISEQASTLAVKLRPSAFIKKQKDGYYDYATNADLQVEKFLLDKIKEKYPNHAVFTEESGEHPGSGDHRWIIDPIDGTWHYKTGQPNYAILIALEDKDGLLLSVARFPELGIEFSSARGKGTFLNGKKTKVSDRDDLASCFVFINHPSFKTPPDLFEWKFAVIKKLTLATYKTFPSHSASFDLFKVAQGVFDGQINSQATGGWWDMASGICAVINAGGKVTTFPQKPVTSENFRDGYVASNGIIHNKLLSIVNQSK